MLWISFNVLTYGIGEHVIRDPRYLIAFWAPALHHCGHLWRQVCLSPGVSTRSQGLAWVQQQNAKIRAEPRIKFRYTPQIIIGHSTISIGFMLEFRAWVTWRCANCLDDSPFYEWQNHFMLVGVGDHVLDSCWQEWRSDFMIPQLPMFIWGNPDFVPARHLAGAPRNQQT